MSASLLPLAGAPAPARGRLLRQTVDPRKSIWQAAVLKYEMEVSTNLFSPDVPCLDSSAAIFDYLTRCEDSFKSFRGDGLQRLRDRLCPIAGVVEMLCGALGEGFAVAFSPSKAIFSAVGVLLKASLRVREEFDAVDAALETIRNHLRILQPLTRDPIDDTLFEASVELLAQILIVLGVITKLQKQGRMKAWIRQLCQTKDVTSALDDLGRLATCHHAAVSAVALATSQRSLSVLVDTVAWMAQERDISRTYLICITKLAQDVYGTAKSSRSILESIQNTLLHHISVNQDDKGLRDFDKLCVWLHYPDSSLRMDQLLRDRADSTGSWFLDDSTYSAFKAGKERTICVLGKAGCGKSTVIAAAIRDLQAWCAISHAPSFVISHFFDLTNSSQSRDLRALLSSLLCQIARNWLDAVPILLKLHAESMMGHSQPPLDALRRCIGAVIRTISTRVFVVIDALDEIQDAAEILSFLAELRAHDNVSLLVSSREIPYRDELTSLCGSTNTMDEDVVTGDIDIVLDRLLCEGGALSEVTDVELVREGLRTGSDGNFRWTVIQANELARVASIPAKPSSSTAVLSLVGSTFITIQDGEVRLAHASVKDYLLSIPSSSQFHVDINIAHSLMSSLKAGLIFTT
ncbi:uncharacterized protein SCHCODRAFT_01193208 [Schizophyllum commune H4-8]|uniref:NACHT domain-containing protein n=1 Tax=Schizophyllum commune (strain H4-8 / FGSC 9210) TaxID=578458 RepID=D8QJ21_SCHCM|nr:uncharacterized protein SCHCODRAFT_01193208 [Schizophyllum commune H4-8]KAI5885791.1 hypothetical protein SCHCODRAFT_01193208 [Schizophyllum commune H4-8]